VKSRSDFVVLKRRKTTLKLFANTSHQHYTGTMYVPGGITANNSQSQCSWRLRM